MKALIRDVGRQTGQSLVEVALFLPILAVALSGIVEVSNVLISQNRLQTATRMSAGFGASHYDPTVWPETAEAMGQVVLNTITETMNLTPDLWDIWSIRAKTNEFGEGFEFAEYRHFELDDAYHQVIPQTRWETVIWPQVQADLLAELQSTGTASAQNVEVVASVAYHSLDTLLGLPIWQWIDSRTISALTVMRVSPPAPVATCRAFPIAVNADNLSVWPSDEPEIPPGGERFPFQPGESYSGENYHWFGWSDDPRKDPPLYTTADNSAFPQHVPGVPLTNARPGYLYLTKQESESDAGGDFGWLRWDFRSGYNNQDTLRQSLSWPGDSHTYYNPPWSDNGLNIYDLVTTSTGSVSAVRDVMRTHVDTEGRTLQLVVFTPESLRGGDYNQDGWSTTLSGGSSDTYEIFGFVIVKIKAWYLPGGHNWLLLEFVRWNSDCMG